MNWPDWQCNMLHNKLHEWGRTRFLSPCLLLFLLEHESHPFVLLFHAQFVFYRLGDTFRQVDCSKRHGLNHNTCRRRRRMIPEGLRLVKKQPLVWNSDVCMIDDLR